MIKKLLAEYIVCGITPALPEDSLIEFYNKSLQHKIGLLFKVNKVRQLKTKLYDERIRSYGGAVNDCHRLQELEKSMVKIIVALIENERVKDDTFLWRVKPKIEKKDGQFFCYFRGGFSCK